MPGPMRFLRSPAQRWKELSVLTAQLDRFFAVASRLDAYQSRAQTGRPPCRVEAQRISLDRQLDQMAWTVERALDRLTAEYLRAQMTRKQQAA